MLLIAATATFLAFLDVTVVNVAFPDLERDFAGSSLSTLSWTVTAYGVTFAALLAPGGRIADVAGRRGVFVGGVAVFTAASAASALAPGVGWLIGARVLQGAGAAAMIPAALSLVLVATPPERRAAAIGLWAAAGSLAAAAGPTLGGLFVEAFGWRSVFVVNVPIGLAAIAAATRLIVPVASVDRRWPDAVGTALLATGLALVVLGCTQAGDWGFADLRTVAAVAGGLVVTAAAVLRARGRDAPAVETALFANRPFAAAALVSLVVGAGLYVWLLSGILFLTGVWGYSVLEAGLAVSPGAFTSAIAGVAAGRLVAGGRFGRVVAAGGLLFAVAGVWLALGVGREPNFLGLWLWVMLLSGVALGLVLTGLATASAASLEAHQFAAGTGLNLTARQIGGAVGVAVAATVLERGGGSVGTYAGVYAACGATGAVAALLSVGVSARRGAVASSTAGSSSPVSAATEGRPA